MRRLNGMLAAVIVLGLLLAGVPSFQAADNPKKETLGGRGGAGGKSRGGSGGEGGAGGDGGVIQLPNLSDKEAAALEATMTAEQKKLFDEYIRLQVAMYARQVVGTKGTAPTAAELRKQTFAFLVLSKQEPRSYWKQLPEMVRQLQKSADPFFVSADERKAADQLPAGFAAEVQKLVSDDLEVFFAARRKVIAQGPRAYALVADLARKVAEKNDKRLTMRLAGVLKLLEGQDSYEKQVRVVEGAYRRVAELRKKAPNEKIAVLVSRMVTLSGLGGSPDYGYRDTCYFSFPKDENGYNGAVSLMFDNGGDEGLTLHSNMYGGAANRLQDLGAIDFASVKKAPAADSPSWGSPRDAWNKGLKAVAGHVYLQHCREDRDGIDMCVKFKVLEAKSRDYVILRWESIPQEK